MFLVWVQRHELDSWWPYCREGLAAGLQGSEGEMDVSQVRMLLTQGQGMLVVMSRVAKTQDLQEWVASEAAGRVVEGCLVLQFIDYPNYRSGFVLSLGGRNILSNPEIWQTFKEGVKSMGVQRLRGSCKPAQARLWRRLGFEPLYQTVEVML